MKSTKYQLLKDDFDHARREIKLRNDMIKELREENEMLKLQIKARDLAIHPLQEEIRKLNKEIDWLRKTW